MKSVRAHVQGGQIVLDEPVELLDGVAVQVLLPDDDMDAKDRAELEAALEESRQEFDRGDFEDAHAFAVRLCARP